MTEDAGRPSWWQTLPGALTALAGVIGAIAGLITVVNQTGLWAHKDTPPADQTELSAHKEIRPGPDSKFAPTCDPRDFTPDRNGNIDWDDHPCLNNENYLTFRGGRTREEKELAADIMSLDHRAHEELGPGTPEWKEVLGMLANAAIALKDGDTDAGRLLYSKADQSFSALVLAKKSR
jgi:hypothetical protein